MKQELNIAAILKDKPKGTKLWTPVIGNCEFMEVFTDGLLQQHIIVYNEVDSASFTDKGKLFSSGECLLFPSKEMRDWSKFAWKKGDVLKGIKGITCIFDSFKGEDYLDFCAWYYYDPEDEDWEYNTTTLSTLCFKKVDESDRANYIKKIEGHYGGKLNLETLEIEKPEPQFKDGDIVSVIDCYSNTQICIVKSIDKNKLEYYASTSHIEEDWLNTDGKTVCLSLDSEKQQLFDALAKEGKRWNAKTKQIEDLPKEYEFKPKDWCLMCNVDEINGKKVVTTEWTLCQFSHYLGDYKIVAVGGDWFSECIPYNEQTKHLLGTTDDWKGGEG